MTEKRQSIFRASHGKENPYFQMLRATARDNAVSFEARGVMAYLLSQSDRWEINKQDIMKRGKIGRTKMDRIIKELIECGYLQMHQEKAEDGTFEKVIYTLFEEPQAQNVQADASEPLVRKPRADKPQADNAQQRTTNGKEVQKESIAPKAQRKPDPLFDALAEYIFDAPPGSETVNAVGGRVGTIERWCKGGDITRTRDGRKQTLPGCTFDVIPQHVAQFTQDWRRNKPGADIPRDVFRFAEHFLAWLEKHLTKPAPYTPPPVPDYSPDEITARIPGGV